MKSITPARRVLAAGAASVLAAGALVASTATTASAAPGSNVYACTTSAGPQDVTVDVDVPGIGAVTALAAGQAVDPQGTLVAGMTFTISDDFHTLLGFLGVQEMEVPAYAADFGNSTVPVAPFSASVTDMEQNADTTWSSSVTTPVQAFEAPEAGSQGVATPSAFGIIATIGGEPVDVDCTISDTPDVLTTVTVVKNDSTTKATSVKKSYDKGSVAKVKVKVAAPNETPGGKVLLKKGTKTLAKANLNDKGIAVLKTKALKVGKNKLSALYKGDGYTNGSKGAVTVKVTR